MMDEEKQNRIQTLQTDIAILKGDLSSENSPIGDWKIAKANEYSMAGIEVPYDMNELHQKRQSVRDQINVMQEELDSLLA